MKFSPKTVDLLKNFASINTGLYFTKGNTLRTMSPQKNVLCEAVVEDTFPQDFAIYDLTNLLSVLGLGSEQPEVEFTPSSIVVNFLNGRSKINYRFTEKSMITVPPDKNLTLPTVDVKFTLTENDLAWIQKTASTLRSPNVAVSSDGDTASIWCFDEKDSSQPTNSVDVGLVSDKKYRLIFKTENLKMIPGTYDVEISSKGIAHFKNSAQNIQYWIAIESTSTFGN
jgi:gp45 sliding clamp, C terminal